MKHRFRNIYRVRESEEKFVAPKNLLMSSGKIFSAGKMFLDSTFFLLENNATGFPVLIGS